LSTDVGIYFHARSARPDHQVDRPQVDHPQVDSQVAADPHGHPEAAQELFGGQGYERTTVRDVAARASIDPAMVMRYFGSKEGLGHDPDRAFHRDLGGLAQQRQPDQPAAGGRFERGRPRLRSAPSSAAKSRRCWLE
jgi:hypothetical protein